MTVRSLIGAFVQQENLNFLLTNRIPRRLLTQFIGWFSRIEHPLIRDLSIAVWRFFSDLDLSDAKKTRFTSVHDCFIRELKDGARSFDPDPNVLASPCDALVGAYGRLAGDELLQIKGAPYSLGELLDDVDLARSFRDGSYVTLRLTSGMYHRFHAPHDCRVEEVRYIAGDAWNVNPISLKRIESLFCKNERAVICARLSADDQSVILVPVGAILVASIRLHFLGTLRGAGSRRRLACDASFRKGDEMGWFEHGSTIVLLTPPGFALAPTIDEGRKIKAGEPVMRVLQKVRSPMSPHEEPQP